MRTEIKRFLIWVLKHFSSSNWLYEVPSPLPRYTQWSATETVSAMVRMGILKEGSLALPVADTGSEDPIVDNGHYFIAEPLVPRDAVNIYIGDWIIADSAVGLRAHHIALMYVEGGGIKIRTRGSNCIADDPDLTTPEQLHYLIRGILY